MRALVAWTLVAAFLLFAPAAIAPGAESQPYDIRRFDTSATFAVDPAGNTVLIWILETEFPGTVKAGSWFVKGPYGSNSGSFCGKTEVVTRFYRELTVSVLAVGVGGIQQTCGGAVKGDIYMQPR